MKQISLILFCAILMACNCSHAQTKLIIHPFQMRTWDKSAKCYKDTTYYVNLNIKDGSLTYLTVGFRTSTPGVKSIWLELNERNIKSYPVLIQSLESIRDKFKEWGQTAIDNKVVDYTKELTEGITSMPPVDVHFKIDNKGAFHTISHKGGTPTIHLKPFFKVSKEGEPYLIISQAGYYGFREVHVSGYAPSLWSMAITPNQERFTLSKFFGFHFNDANQIQSLIDALDYSKDLEKLQTEERELKQKNDSIDKLFK